MPRRRTPSLTLAFAAVSVLANVALADDAVDFQSQIRPVLSQHCFTCHGPDDAVREADLRLDRKASATADRGGYAIVVPGNPDQSVLIERIESDDPDQRMPPADHAERLSEDETALIRRWIDEGASWQEHWSFVPPQRPETPTTKNAAWIRNPIDAFVLARLEAEGIEPSPPADPVTLARRLSLDLVGLPPEVDDVDAFVDADQRADKAHAYRAYVDRLLDSPHYGERWGRIWLDAARYADSDGFEKDKPRQVWFYRDWVVAALNRDVPYDDFIIEQIAGDLLPNATQSSRVATGFLRNSMINEEGGVDPEQFRMAAMFDRMDAIGRSVLGLTVQCAQCHDHKYDPLSQADYYSMFAYLNDCYEANIAVYTPAEQALRTEILAGIDDIEDSLKRELPDWSARLAAWEVEQHSATLPEWIIVKPGIDEISAGGQKYRLLDDGSLLAEGYAPTKHRAQFTVETDETEITGFRLELLNHPNLPRGGPGRSVEGTAALTEFEIQAKPADDSAEWSTVEIASATADLEISAAPLKAIYHDNTDKQRVIGPIAYAIDGKDETAWGIDAAAPRRNLPRKAVFTAAEPFGYEGGTVVRIFLSQKHGGWNSDDNQNHNLGRFRLSLTTAQAPVADPLPRSVRAALAVDSHDRTEEQTREIFSFWRTTVDEWSAANARIEALWNRHPEGTTQLVLHRRPEPRTTHMLDRGDFLRPTEPVQRGVPAFLHPLESAPDEPPRLAFARWLVDRRSPTTARAIVNRVWQAYFGHGLVATSEDLGSQGEAPSHPELLDWLAVEFMDSGWRLKELHRLIVTSATYRQSSAISSPERYERDPDNRLLARGSRMRVDAEIVRDVALAVSGLLNCRVGGPSVYPPAPAFLFQRPASYGPKVWNTATDDDRYRRALYTFRFRSVPHPALTSFDAPNGDTSCVRRTRSNTPLAALVALNEPLFVEAARALAKTAISQSSADDAVRLDYAFRRCLARHPEPEEVDTLMRLLDQQRARLSSGELNAAAIVGSEQETEATEAKPTDAETEWAAWTVVARVLLNLDETITRE